MKRSAAVTLRDCVAADPGIGEGGLRGESPKMAENLARVKPDSRWGSSGFIREEDEEALPIRVKPAPARLHPSLFFSTLFLFFVSCSNATEF